MGTVEGFLTAMAMTVEAAAPKPRKVRQAGNF
jgi:hypothetical protein